VTTDASGNAAIVAHFTATVHVVTATATDPAGNTSEFSACKAAVIPTPTLSEWMLILLAVTLALFGAKIIGK
jgi:hypothetical protein